MPHLQPSSERQISEGNRVSVGFLKGMVPEDQIPSSQISVADNLPIQEATKGFLGTSDPDIAMANKTENAEKVSFDDSFEENPILVDSSSPESSLRTSKSLVTPSPNESMSRLVSEILASRISGSSTNSEKTSSTDDGEIEGGPPILTIYGRSRLLHSPIRVKRRVSHSEDDDTVLEKMNSDQATHLRYVEENLTEVASRSSLIQMGSSTGSRSDEKNTKAPFKRVKTNGSNGKGDNTTASTDNAAVEAASAMAGMRKKSVIPQCASGDRTIIEQRYRNRSEQGSPFDERIASQTYSPYDFRKHSLYSHSGFGYATGAPPMYHGYPPHPSPYSAVSGAQPGMGYYPPFHAASQPLLHPYQHALPQPPTFHHTHRQPSPDGSHLTKPTMGSSGSVSITPEESGAVFHDSVNSDSGVFRSVSDLQHGARASGGLPPSSNRCVPLKEPVPSKSWGENTEDTIIPDFHRLVNFPDFLTKARNEAACSDGKKNCVMCGKLRICSTTNMNKGRHEMGNSEDTSHIIPRQNKGLCTACDVTVWVLVKEGTEIKWCKGCKNFRPWAAFGNKGSATKCTRCRERQREKYAMQRDESRSRPFPKGTHDSLSNATAADGSTKDKAVEKPRLAAAQGLHNLLNAATTV